MNMTVNGVQFPVGTNATTVALCGSGNATITAPPGLGPYTWNGPPGSGVTNVNNQSFITNFPGQYTVTMNPIGACTPITRLVNFSISVPPTAAFNFTYTPCTTTLNVQSTSNTNGGAAITGYQWVWGDATPNGTLSAESHSYTTPGPKQIKLVVTNSAGCKDSITQNINVTLPPFIDFTVSPVCFGLNSNFTNISTTGGAAANNYTWTFGGGGGTSNVVSPSMNFPTAGIFTVSLVGTNTGGCSNSMVKSFTVYPKPTASFNFTNLACTSTVNVLSTTNLNGGSAVGLQWVWGDATPNSNLNPETHNYATIGPKQIKLVVTNAEGCKDSITQNLNITLPPIIDFTVSPVCHGLNSNFTNISTTGGAASNNYTWTFGGGGGTSTSSNPSISFPTPGSFTVNLLGVNSDGCSNNITKNYTVFPKPTISFAANPVCFGTVTNFTNNSSVLAPSSITNWFWDFTNDNVTDNTTQSPGFTYPASGTFQVELKAQSNFGCTDSALVNIVVSPNPTVNFTAVNACKKYAIVLNNTSNVTVPSSMSSYTWNFGSGNGTSMAGSNATNPTGLTYTVDGIKTITLTGLTNNGCSSTMTGTVEVYASPTASFNANGICSGIAMTFTDNSSPAAPAAGAVSGWAWDFDNNGSTDNTTQNPSNNFGSSGIYTVGLIATSANGCTDTIKKAVNVYGRAVVDFTPTGVCFGAASNFTNLTSTSVNPNTGAQSTFSWSFGDGGSSSSQNPVYTYANPLNATNNTTYNVTFYVTTINGCKDSVIKPVMVYSRPTPNFIADSVCLGNITTLQDASNANGNPFVNFSWDWNNDNVPDVTNNSLSTQNTFTAWGNISVTYTVFTSPNNGALVCYNSITKNVWVHPGPLAGITNINTCIDTQPMQISGVTSSIPVGNISNYAWNYGDGGSSALNAVPVTTHSYATPGIYTVTLTVSSPNGCSSSGTKTVEVWDRPYGSFVYSKTCLTKTTTLTAMPSSNGGAVASYAWDYNNSPLSAEASGAQVTHTFAAAGQQTLNLLLTSVNGCKNVIPGNVYINHNPKPNFYAPKRMGCTDFCIELLDSTAILTGPAQNVNWEWNFGNGAFESANSNGKKAACYSNSSFYNPLKYDVKLTVRTDSGCVDSIRRKNYVVVYPKPRADFSWSPENGDVLTPIISFTNTSEGFMNFQWYFNDAPNSLDSSNNTPKHYFKTDDPMSINVFLAIRNSYGCKDTVIKPIEIGPNFTFYIPNTFTPNGDGVNDLFAGKGIGIKEYKMWIYDRWGEMIFYTGDISKGWDGTVKGKQVDGKQDVYQWKVIVTDLKDKDHIYVGHVTQLNAEE
jgi:gliding motility-associated-like protein